MRIGFAVPQSGPWATPANMRRIAARAERLGYAELWTFQRVLYPVGHPMGPVYRSVHDPVVTLSYLAGVTETIRLGVAVINAYVQPVVLAKQLASLQIVSGGRLTAGLGLGWLREEFEAAGVGFERRGRRVEEFTQVLREALTEDVIEHSGEFYRVPASHLDPRPEHAPPILLGGAAEPALRRAGRLADGWISSSREDLAGIAPRVAVIKEAAREAGRDPEALRLVCRGVTRVRPAGAREEADGGRSPLTGTYEEIRRDVDDLMARGVTEVFHDLNFDPEIVTAEPEEAMRRAEEALEALAPNA
ncbi:TIGR03619 family F420-dependent LLM class oxidoreductase [Nonomuraea rhodomycinica]|uniref:TIGR03619 family F420-dependent LLM class oxidoreductase n=1 Tax=Nonomuraea rhodomycinica TaxID=1712872 RepID=A0A7Y6M9Y8_9ACTN|nr:TIGR03619 family F420-dependent LLM class oxidoreductase [Nonomuraea rhodomycinica]NUW39290.1 TIGR03619 family F420-dependent LLM class oxidoreductase [Nonomuraea rhodomycinica]